MGPAAAIAREQRERSAVELIVERLVESLVVGVLRLPILLPGVERHHHRAVGCHETRRRALRQLRETARRHESVGGEVPDFKRHSLRIARLQPGQHQRVPIDLDRDVPFRSGLALVYRRVDDI